MDRTKRNFLAAAAGLTMASLVPRLNAKTAEGRIFTPEMFGAKGDGVTNDTAAFAALSKQVNANGGGIVRFKRRTYLLGAQKQTKGEFPEAFRPDPLLQFRNCSKPLVIQGNGATLKCAAGLRFGTFHPVTGEPTKHPMPFIDRSEWSSPYEYMILAEGCTGPVSISDLELDGNLSQLRIGGPYGDTGWQIPATGIYLVDNRGDEIVRNIYSHHHAQDGLMINGIDDAALAARVTRRIENVRSEYNGRQGCSITGGRGYAFRGCKFNHTGKAGLASAPGAGVDIEAEGEKTNRDFSFTDCEFANNTGCGMVADSGDSAGALFTKCRFIGSTSWSAWPRKPRFEFRDCLFVGAIVQAYAASDESEATLFRRCTFTDDPALSPTQKVYLPSGTYGAIADLNELGNPVFANCTFKVSHGAQLPWSLKAVYRDCEMVQVSTHTGYPRGIYQGRNRITGDVGLHGAKIEGELLLNGRRIVGVQL